MPIDSTWGTTLHRLGREFARQVAPHHDRLRDAKFTPKRRGVITIVGGRDGRSRASVPVAVWDTWVSGTPFRFEDDEDHLVLREAQATALGVHLREQTAEPALAEQVRRLVYLGGGLILTRE